MNDSIEIRSLLRDPATMSGRIALYGGTFDPVQRAHIEVARRACESFDLSAIIFIPVNQNPLKSHSPGASNSDRLKMIDLAIGMEARFYVSDLEISRQQGPSYTVETVHYFKQHLTSASALYFLCGSDNLPRLHQWHRIEEIFAILDGFLVVEREEFLLGRFDTLSLSEAVQRKIFFEKVQREPIPITATMVREHLLHDRESARNFLAPQVFEYIERKNLYRAVG